ncbi:3'-5' exonuclease family protein [Histomonas meleagridis]|uniref:3'-5' exonuclease family protein n=1 Tax=Histomonas meleagridis TaxID=135588 RepID=UPI003559D932|nr:3'-5' exonuclease family protein [Histomonas meleagridis]KAH0799796.1 3'-5' exonuclease family protein [Histomonas meleagridis]
MEFEEIHFNEGDTTLVEYEEKYWQLRETRKVEFFPGELTTVSLISVEDPDLKTYLNNLAVDPIISLDLEWDEELCLFQFCSSSGVLIIRHPNGPGNQILKEFLSTHKFYAKGAGNDKKQLDMKFGETFTENIEDISVTRLVPYHYSENFMDMTVQFAGVPTAIFKELKITKSHWSQEVLTIRQVLYAAFDVVSLFKCYPNFPAPKIKNKPNKPTKPREHKPAPPPGVPINTKKTKEKKQKKKEPPTVEKVDFVQNYRINRYCYLVKNYKGSLLRKDLHKYVGQSDENIEFISYFPNGDGTYQLYISLLKEIDPSDEIIHLPYVDPNQFNDNDILYIKDIPSRVSSRDQIEKFLYLFERDHNLYFRENFIMIEFTSATSPHVLSCFLPYITIDNEQMKVYTFPYFLNAVFAINLPSTADEAYVRNLFSPFGPVKCVTFPLMRDETVPKSVAVFYASEDSPDKAITNLNFKEIDGNEVYVSRYTKGLQLRTMRNYQLYYETKESSREIYEKFSSYGPIHFAYYDKKVGIGVVQFYHMSDAFKAMDNTTAYMRKEGTTIIMREVSCAFPDEEVIEMCEKYGKVLSFFVRLVIPRFRYQVLEVTFTTPEAASSAKAELDHMVLDSIPINVSLMKGNGNEVSIWKMEYRFKWIAVDKVMDEVEILEKFQKFGDIIDFNVNSEKTFVMFATDQQAIEATNQTGYQMPTIHEYAYFTHNNYLQTKFIKPHLSTFTESEEKKAIVMDPVPDSFTKKDLEAICPGCFYDSLVTASTVDGCSEKRRVIIYPFGKRMQKKTYALLRSAVFDGVSLNPMIMNQKEIPKLSDVSPMTINVDPLPEELQGSKLRTNVLMDKEAIVDILPSITEIGQKMAVVMPKEKATCRTILRSLRRWRTPIGTTIHVEKFDNEK